MFKSLFTEKEIKRVDSNWLKYLDGLYKSKRTQETDSSYFFYPRTSLKSSKEKIEFITLKQFHTKFIFGDEYGRRVYLTDADIVGLIAQFNEKDFSLVIEALKKLYKAEEEQIFEFEIENKSFSIPKLPFEDEILDYFKQIDIVTKADITISFYDFIVLLNLIIEKENLADQNKGFRKKRQIIKYIVLSSFYRNGDFREILETEGYDISSEDIHGVYTSKTIQKKIDLVFNKLSLFEKKF